MSGELTLLSSYISQGVDPVPLNGRIIECTWSNEVNMWSFHRIREDKTEPNAEHVYTKVVGSIRDNIKEAELLNYLTTCFLKSDAYERDRKRVPPELMPAMPADEKEGQEGVDGDGPSVPPDAAGPAKRKASESSQGFEEGSAKR